MKKYFIIFMSIISLSAFGAGDLKASMARIPGLADTPDKGAFVEIVKAMRDVYTDGDIKIELYPFARSVYNVTSGSADFHIPSIRNNDVDQSKLPYNTVTAKMGTVYQVIYSNAKNPITKKMLDKAVADFRKGKPFPYKIEGASGIENQYSFPIISSNNIELSLKKVSVGRIDALVWSQEECDLVIKQRKMSTIYRDVWYGFDDVIIIPKGKEGKELDKVLSELLNKLKKSGKLDELYLKVHSPYAEWQPSEMGWPAYIVK